METHRPFVVHKVLSLVVIATVACLVSNPDARASRQQESLKEIARRHNGVARMLVNVDAPFFSLEDLASKSDLIVQARIESATSQLAVDELSVITAYAFQPLHVLKDAVGANASATPGPTVPMVFTMPGGKVLTEGLTISMTVKPEIDPPLRAGDEVIVFLRWNSAERTFQQQYGDAGLLYVRGDRVVAASKDYARLRPLADDRLTAMIAELQTMVKEGKK